MSHVAIVLLNYNSTPLTKNCIASLWSNKKEGDTYSILVWDNASETAPTQRELGKCELIISSTNDGFALGYNKAVAHALRTYHPDYLLILNNDTRVPRGMVHALTRTCSHEKDNAIVVPKIYFERGHEFHMNSYSRQERGTVLWYAGGEIDWNNIILFHRGVDEVDRGQFEVQEQTVFVTGCCFLTTPKIWKKLGGFDPKFFMYYEDADLSLKAKRTHIPLIYEPKAHLYHINAGSAEGSGSVLQQYYQTRNRLKFGLQYAGMRAKLALLKEAYQIWKTGTPVQRRAVLHAVEGRWGKQDISALAQ